MFQNKFNMYEKLHKLQKFANFDHFCTKLCVSDPEIRKKSSNLFILIFFY